MALGFWSERHRRGVLQASMRTKPMEVIVSDSWLTPKVWEATLGGGYQALKERYTVSNRAANFKRVAAFERTYGSPCGETYLEGQTP